MVFHVGVEKSTTQISGCCSYMESVTLISSSYSLKAEAKLTGFLKVREIIWMSLQMFDGISGLYRC